MKYRWLALLSIVLLLVVACGSGAAEDNVVETREIDPSGPSESPLDAPSIGDSVLPTPSLGTEARTLVNDLKEIVAQQLGVAPKTLSIIFAEPTTWSDASLGCPEPGRTYAQILVEGWRVIFVDAEGRQYDVHMGADPTSFVICEESEFSVSPGDEEVDKVQNPAVEAAITQLLSGMPVERAQIKVAAVHEMQWPNSCLGCARPKENCLMVITPGYRVILQHGDTLYDMHTDRNGNNVRFCGEIDGPVPLPNDGEVK